MPSSDIEKALAGRSGRNKVILMTLETVSLVFAVLAMVALFGYSLAILKGRLFWLALPGVSLFLLSRFVLTIEDATKTFNPDPTLLAFQEQYRWVSVVVLVVAVAHMLLALIGFAVWFTNRRKVLRSVNLAAASCATTPPPPR